MGVRAPQPADAGLPGNLEQWFDAAHGVWRELAAALEPVDEGAIEQPTSAGATNLQQRLGLPRRQPCPRHPVDQVVEHRERRVAGLAPDAVCLEPSAWRRPLLRSDESQTVGRGDMATVVERFPTLCGGVVEGDEGGDGVV